MVRKTLVGPYPDFSSPSPPYPNLGPLKKIAQKSKISLKFFFFIIFLFFVKNHFKHKKTLKKKKKIFLIFLNFFLFFLVTLSIF